MEKYNKEIFASGLSKEFLESSDTERDPLNEFIQDYEVIGFSILIIEKALEKYLNDKKIKNKNIISQIENILEELNKLEAKWRNISEQGELFKIIDDGSGNQVSVKQNNLKQIKKDLHEWFSVVSGVVSSHKKVTSDFETVQNLGNAVFSEESPDKRKFYGRGFSESVYEWEKNFAKEIGVDDVALCSSGMSAIENALRAENIKPGDTIMVGTNFYYNTNLLINELADKGIKVVKFEMADLTDELITVNKPRLIFIEGIENNISMRTIDIDNILEMNSSYNGKNPDNTFRLIIDNTFASSFLLNIGEYAKKHEHSKWAGVESATKYYQQGMDNITAGIVYSNDSEYIKRVKNIRATIGTNLQDKLTEFLPSPDAELFSQKMIRHSMNAMYLSSGLEKFGFKVSYPLLPSHPDNKKTAFQYKEGAGGVFFIKWENKNINPQEYVNNVKKEAKKLGVEVKIGVSFGHPETWLETLNPEGNWTDNNSSNWEIRIAAGEENIADIKKVLQAFKNASNN